MDRRNFNRTLLTGGVVAVLAPSTLLLEGCAPPKDLGFYIDTVTGAMKQLAPLLPGAAGAISKVISVAGDLSAAYKRGDFASAESLFATLSDDLAMVAADAGVNSPTIKLALAVAGIALSTIAAILHAQATPAMVVSARKVASPAQLRSAELIEKSVASADAVFALAFAH